MILYINKTKGNVTTKTEVYGGNFTFDYLPDKKRLLVYYGEDWSYEYKVKDIQTGLNGHIVDAFLDDEEE